MPNDKKFRDFNINKKHLLSTHLMGTPVYIHLLQRKIEKKNGFKNIKSFHLMGFSQSQKFKQIKRTKTYTQAKRSLTFFFGRSTKNNLKLINFTFFRTRNRRWLLFTTPVFFSFSVLHSSVILFEDNEMHFMCRILSHNVFCRPFYKTLRKQHEQNEAGKNIKYTTNVECVNEMDETIINNEKQNCVVFFSLCLSLCWQYYAILYGL